MSYYIRLFAWCVILFSLSYTASLSIMVPDQVLKAVYSVEHALGTGAHSFATHFDPFMSVFLFGIFWFANRMAGGSLTSSS